MAAPLCEILEGEILDLLKYCGVSDGRRYEINEEKTWPSEEKIKRYQNYLLD